MDISAEGEISRAGKKKSAVEIHDRNLRWILTALFLFFSTLVDIDFPTSSFFIKIFVRNQQVISSNQQVRTGLFSYGFS